jgi:hypothetical protein
VVRGIALAKRYTANQKVKYNLFVKNRLPKVNSTPVSLAGQCFSGVCECIYLISRQTKV